MLVLLLVGLSVSSAGSFRRERESGAMELLLVTPLREGQVIWGRLRGLWGQFLPAVMLIGAFAGFWHLQESRIAWWWGSPETDLIPAFMILLGATYVALPVIGLYFSLRRKSFLAAWLNTLVVAVGIPYLWGLTWFAATHWMLPPVAGGGSIPILATMAALEIGLGSWFWRRLRERLRRRQFALATGSVTA
jgi:ABC-type Na+ efflux pump permease subunit